MSRLPDSPTLLFSAFEPSGDGHAAPVIRELKRRHPDWRLLALGGPKMQQAGAELLAHTVDKAAMGLNAIAKAREVHRHVQRATEEARRAGVVLHVPVDSPAANFPLCKRLRPMGIRIVHLVAPQLWAWGPWRLRKLKRLTDLVLCLLPFEERWFRERGVPAVFIGHPVINRTLDESALDREASTFPAVRPRLGVFPGSRPHEVERNLSLFIEVIRSLRKEDDSLSVVIAAASESLALRVKREVDESETVRIETGVSDAVIRWCDVALAVSGTVSLDMTRQAKPLVGVYRVTRASRLLAGMLLRTPFRLLPNIVAGRLIVPEFVPYAGGAGPIVEALRPLVRDEARRAAMRNDLEAARAAFDGHQPDIEAADLIERVLRGERAGFDEQG